GQSKGHLSLCQSWEFENNIGPGRYYSSPEHKTEEYCPWMKHQVRECQPVTVVDPQVSRDVLSNLQNLLDAEDLIKVADNLCNRGHVGEALDCYEIISK